MYLLLIYLCRTISNSCRPYFHNKYTISIVINYRHMALGIIIHKDLFSSGRQPFAEKVWFCVVRVRSFRRRHQKKVSCKSMGKILITASFKDRILFGYLFKSFFPNKTSKTLHNAIYLLNASLS